MTLDVNISDLWPRGKGGLEYNPSNDASSEIKYNLIHRHWINLGNGEDLDKILNLVKSRWWDLSGSLTMAPKIHPSRDLDLHRKFATIRRPKQTFHKTLWIADCGLGFNKNFYGSKSDPILPIAAATTSCVCFPNLKIRPHFTVALVKVQLKHCLASFCQPCLKWTTFEG